jgi:hypothetical protein
MVLVPFDYLEVKEFVRPTLGNGGMSLHPAMAGLTIEAYPAARYSPASAGFTDRNSSYFLIRCA